MAHFLNLTFLALVLERFFLVLVGLNVASAATNSLNVFHTLLLSRLILICRIITFTLLKIRFENFFLLYTVHVSF